MVIKLKTAVFFILLETVCPAYAMPSLTIACPMTLQSSQQSLIGVNVFEAKSKLDTNRFVLAPDNQIYHKKTNLYTQYWNKPTQDTEGLKRYVECLYSHSSPNNSLVIEIPPAMECRFVFINKPKDKGIVTKNSKARFYCLF